MKKICFKICVSILLILFLSSCLKNPVNYKLKVTSGYWDGWSEHTEEEMLSWQQIKTYDVVRGFIIDDLQGWNGFSITIRKVSESSITIKTSTPMSSSDVGIDMRTTQNKFILNKGDVLNLDTPSYDAGFYYYLELIEE